MAIYQPPVNTQLGRVSVWSRNATVPPKLAECLPSAAPLSTHDTRLVEMPEKADYYIVESLGVEVEREAARLHALPVCLPEATDWLRDQVWKRTKAGEPVAICMRRRP